VEDGAQREAAPLGARQEGADGLLDVHGVGLPGEPEQPDQARTAGEFDPRLPFAPALGFENGQAPHLARARGMRAAARRGIRRSRSSSSSLWRLASASCTIVRNLYAINGVPPLPTTFH